MAFRFTGIVPEVSRYRRFVSMLSLAHAPIDRPTDIFIKGISYLPIAQEIPRKEFGIIECTFPSLYIFAGYDTV